MLDVVNAAIELLTSQATGIFSLLFLNNMLMYFVLNRRHKAEVRTLVSSQATAMRCANSANRTLRSIVYAFSDEVEEFKLPVSFDCLHSHRHGGKCFIKGEHVH